MANGEPGIENVFKKTDEAEMELEEEQTAGRVGQGGFVAPGVWASGADPEKLEELPPKKKKPPSSMDLQEEIASLKKQLGIMQAVALIGAAGLSIVFVKPKWFGFG